ncbi:polysaccharide biosynthesis tyrosine autokinase [Candidatus Binatia bacterium]|nr:polysaccharide biosynthesis tyrosine autokinase [Candidatus Binatia bacterium]
MRQPPRQMLPPGAQLPANPADVAPPPIQLDMPVDPYASDEEPRFLEYWRLLRNNWQWIAGGAGAAAVVAIVYLLVATSMFTAESKIMIERQSQNALNVQELLADGMSGDESNFYRTQEQILKSRTLAVDVIRELGLERNPDFVEQEGEADGLVSGWIQGLVGLFKSGDERLDPSGIAPDVIRAYQEGLSVSPVTRTKLAVVRFTTPNPELSAEIANTHVRAYMMQGLRLRSEASEEARGFLDEKLVEVKQKLHASEAALNAYRKDKGIVTLNDEDSVIVDRLADLNDLLTEAESNRITLEADVKLIKGRAYDSLPAVANSTLIQALKSQLAEKEGAYVELAAQFKPAYPPVQNAKAEVDALRARLDGEIQQVVASIESKYLAAADRETQLRATMDTQRAKVLDMKDAGVQYAILEREANTNEQLYENILSRMKEIGVAAAVQASNVSIIDKATPPENRSSPQRLRTLLLALLMGTGLGAGIVLGRDFLDNSVKNTEDVERYLQLPSLGIVPDFDALPDQSTTYGYGSRSRTKAAGVAAKFLGRSTEEFDETLDGVSTSDGHAMPDADLVGEETVAAADGQMQLVGAVPESDSSLVLAQGNDSVVSEAYRTLRTAILFSTPEEAPQTMMFTSALESEGKTTTSLNTAIVFARLGARVLIIDADMRRASCHGRFGVSNDYGLSEVLTGQRNFDEVVVKTKVDGVQMLTAGALPPNPTELLASSAMEKLLARCAEHFDYVIVDSPPVMAVNDAVVMGHMVDGVVMVVRAHHTPRQILQRAEARLLQARSHVLGVLLNKVDAKTDNYATYYGGKYYSTYYAGEDTRGGNGPAPV